MKIPILLPNIFNHPFTYKTNIKLKIGDFVEVPFGKKNIIGVVWDEFEKKSQKTFKIKSVIRKVNIPATKADPMIKNILIKSFSLSKFSLIEFSRKYFSINVIESPTKLGATSAKILAIIVIRIPIIILFLYFKKNLFKYLSSFI